MDYKEHWDKVYSNNEIKKFGWYEKYSQPSLKLIENCNLDKNAVILDVGSGATTLIKELLINGYTNLFANDISHVALNKAKNNLTEDEQQKVKWITGDITESDKLVIPRQVDLWHDRTVLHFLTYKTQREGYVKALQSIVKRNGFVIIAVFSIGGAKKCSGLNVINYNEKMIADLLGNEFNLIDHFNYLHIMPSGDKRPYIYTTFQRK